MYRRLLLVVLLSTGALCTSCEVFSKKKEQVAHPDPNGSVNEKIAYHRSEIMKYETARDKEKHTSLRSLQNRDMSEVRRSNNKIARYERKIDENKSAIAYLESQRKD